MASKTKIGVQCTVLQGKFLSSVSVGVDYIEEFFKLQPILLETNNGGHDNYDPIE